MTRLMNSPPEAYAPPLPPQARHTVQLGDRFGPETPGQAQARAVDIYQKSLSGELGVGHNMVVAAEAQLYGIEPGSGNIPALLDARRAKITGYDHALRAAFERRAPMIVERLAEDVAEEGEDPAAIKDILQKRIDEVWVEVEDPLLLPDNEIAFEAHSAGFRYQTGAVELNYAALLMAEATWDPAPTIDDAFFDNKSDHEGLHALFARWFDADSQGEDALLTNGMDLMNGHGNWINEGTIEKYRAHRLEGKDIVYEGAVVALAVADALDPDFEKARLRAAVFNEGHGGMIGRLERLFGPDAPQSVGALIETITSQSKIPEYRHKLLAMLPEDLREKGAAAFDQEVARFKEQWSSGDRVL